VKSLEFLKERQEYAFPPLTFQKCGSRYALIWNEENDYLKKTGFKELIKMIKDGLVSSRGGKDILAVLFENGGDPNSIAKEKGLIKQNDEGTLKLIVEELIKENPNVVQDFKNGKESALQFFVGQGMKKSKGSANPKVLMDIVKKSLS
jgi:aspartyl-tRNA(Asn)/glutamyl-tRNA(Gln) amidotransferase subunit B